MKKKIILIILFLFSISICLSSSEPDYGCSFNEIERENIKNYLIMNLSENFPNYSFYDYSMICFEYNNINYYSGSIIGKERINSVMGEQFIYEIMKQNNTYYINNIMSEKFYNFSDFFSNEEINILGEELQEKIFLYEKKEIIDEKLWISIIPENMDECRIFELNFKTLNGEKYFKQYDNYCAGYLKTNISSLRSLAEQKKGIMYFVGKNILFEFVGRANSTNSINRIMNKIENCSVCNIKDECYTNPPQPLNHSCYAYFYDKKRIYITKNYESNNIGMTVNILGHLNNNGVVSIYGWMIDDSNKKIINNFVKNTTKTFLGEKISIPYSIYSKNNQFYFSGNTSINKISFNHDSLKGLNKNFHQTIRTYYDEGRTYVTIGEEYVSFIKYDLSNKWVDDFTTITKDSVNTIVFLEKINESLARKELSKKVSNYTEVDEELWNIDYYIVPGKEWIYLGGEGVVDYLIEKSDFSAGNPASTSVFMDEFSQILGTEWIIEEENPYFKTIFTLIWLACSIMIAYMFLYDIERKN